MTTVQRMTLVATSLGLFMVFLDALIVNVALPDIQAQFGVGEAGLQWVVTAYSLGMAMFIMSMATFADLKGRRRLFLPGLVVFTAASIACGLAPNIVVLNLARFVQGMAAAAVTVTSLALVSSAFPDPDRKARAIGLWNAIASTAIAIGPTLGGILTQGIGWRWVFLVNVPVGVLAVVLTLRYVGESKDPAVDRSFDGVGQVLFIVAIGALAYGVIAAPQQGWLSPLILGLLLTSLVVGIVFVVLEARSDDPMMDVRLFKDRTYSVAIAMIFVAFFSVYGMLLVVTQYLQNVKLYSPAMAGFLILPFSVTVFVLSPIAGNLVAKLGHRTPILLGSSGLFVGLALIFVGTSTSTVIVCIGLGAMGAGAALSLTPITALAMQTVPPERAGMASGIMSAQRALGSTVGFAVMGSILAVWLAATLPADLTPAIPDPGERAAVTNQIIAEADPNAYAAEIGPGRPIPTASTADQAEMAAAADSAFVAGIRVALALAAFLVLVAGVVGAILLPHRRGDESEVDHEERALEAEEEQGRTPSP